MDSTQFVWWLKGFLANKDKLSQEDLQTIKSEADKVWLYPWICLPNNPVQPLNPTPPYYIGDPPYGGSGTIHWQTQTDLSDYNVENLNDLNYVSASSLLEHVEQTLPN